jgi:hypothetical protein
MDCIATLSKHILLSFTVLIVDMLISLCYLYAEYCYADYHCVGCCYADYHWVGCCYADYHYAGFRYGIIRLDVVMLLPFS